MNSFHLPFVNKPLIEFDIELEMNEKIPKTPIICCSLFTYLQKVKDEITKHSKEWDKYKKYTNPYEYIHTIVPSEKSSVCKLMPVSRSFFKMIEIIKLYNILDTFENTHIKSFHLAEGPGGFIEALSYLRKSNINHFEDIYYGITIIKEMGDQSIPNWKKIQDNSKVTNFIPIYGHDEYGIKGDITNPKNFFYCKDNFAHTIDIVTADGGFDFTNDFNNQEIMATRLVLSEILTALTIQKTNGTFILKIYDVFTKIMVEALYILSAHYYKVYIYKPMTSRSANSEKYIICIGFKSALNKNMLQKFSDIFNTFYTQKDLYIHKLLKYDISHIYESKIQDIMTTIGQQQLDCIMSTLNMIAHKKIERIEMLKKSHIINCIEWCKKHNLPMNSF